MATAAYSTNGTNGKFAPSIAWINWGSGFSLGIGATQNLSITLTDGEVVSFTVTNSTAAGTGASIPSAAVPTYTDSAFGRTGYMFGTNIFAAIYSSVSTNRFRLDLSNIVVKTSGGVTIPNYTMFFAEAESMGATETATYTSNGGGFEQLLLLPIPAGGGGDPTVSGLGTGTLSLTGSGSGGKSIVAMSSNPTTASATYTGYSGFALGFSVTKLLLQSNIVSRISYSDQFVLTIAGTSTTSVTTTGNTYGIQNSNKNLTYITPGSTYTINESMAPGSVSILSEYTQSVSSSNATTGGTTVTTLNKLGASVTVTVGDYITSTIINTFTIPNITTTKTVDSVYADINDTLNYTLVLKNTGALQAINVNLIDTTPAGCTFLSNSLNINGTATTANPALTVQLGTIPTGGTTTVTYSILTPNTLPTINPVVNIASATYTGASVGSTNSNSVSSKVNASFLTANKTVNKSYAALGDILTYTIPIIITGNTNPNSVYMIDTIPNEAVFIQNSLAVNGSIISWANPQAGYLIGTIPMGTTTVSYNVCVVSIPSPNQLKNSANISYTYIFDPSLPNSPLKYANTNIISTTINTPIVNGVKTTDKYYTTANDIVTYTIVLRNTGTAAAANFVLRDTIPSGTTFVTNSINLNGTTLGGTPLSINVGTIVANGTSTITFKVKVN